MNVNIYQVFTRLFRNDNGSNTYNGSIAQNGSSKFNHFTNEALHEIKKMGYTHIWFTGVIRHACATAYPEDNIQADHPAIVKGKAGSPYAIKDYFDVVPDLAEHVPNRMQEFESLIERCHQNELKVIVDFVPNHVCRQYQSALKPDDIPALGQYDDTSMEFSPANNFYYIPGEPFEIPDEIDTEELEPYHELPAKATGNNVFRAKPAITDWYETVKLNYGVDFHDGAKEHFDPIPPTWYRMYEVLEFWASKGVDGFRIDMAEMVPMDFWEWVVPKTRERYHQMLFIAEVYQPVEYKRFIEQAQFDWLYDKEQFYNIVRAVIEGKAPASVISKIWKEQEGIEKHMLRFLENHDEQRIASDFFASDPQKAIPGMVLTATMHKGPVMVYFGQELGERGMYEEGFSGCDGKTTIFDYWKVEHYQNWVNKGRFDGAKLDDASVKLREQYNRLLHLRKNSQAVIVGDFYDLMWVNDHIDTNNIYTYIRHTEEQVLLVILNFDHISEKAFSLNLPIHAAKHVGLDVKEQIQACILYGEHPCSTFHLNQQNSLSADFKIGSSSGLIFELSCI